MAGLEAGGGAVGPLTGAQSQQQQRSSGLVMNMPKHRSSAGDHAITPSGSGSNLVVASSSVMQQPPSNPTNNSCGMLLTY